MYKVRFEKHLLGHEFPMRRHADGTHEVAAIGNERRGGMKAVYLPQVVPTMDRKAAVVPDGEMQSVTESKPLPNKQIFRCRDWEMGESDGGWRRLGDGLAFHTPRYRVISSHSSRQMTQIPQPLSPLTAGDLDL